MIAVRPVVLLCVVLLSLVAVCFGQVPPFAPASTVAPPFQGRYYSQATTFYGRTLLYGGIGADGTDLNDVWSSRDDGASWTFVANTGLPPRFSGAFVTVQTVVNNTQLLLSIGGFGPAGYNNDVYFSLDGATFIPSGLAAFSARAAFAYTIALPVQDQSGNPTLNGLPALFVLGGSNASSNALNDVYYSSGRGVFNYVLATAQAPWPARAYHSAVAVESGTRIVITGGQTSSTTFNDVWISDVGGVNWIQLLAAAPFRARYGFGFVNIGEKLTVFGGAAGQGTQYINDVYSSLDYGRSWTRVTTNAAFTARTSFSFAVNGKDVVTIDGFGPSGVISGVGGVLNGPLN